jgi:hypothetical protein
MQKQSSLSTAAAVALVHACTQVAGSSERIGAAGFTRLAPIGIALERWLATMGWGDFA